MAAVLEWTLAFIYTFYVLSFVLDLLPAVRTKHHMSHPAVAEAGLDGYANGHHHGQNGYTNGEMTSNSNMYGTNYVRNGGAMEAGGRDVGYSANY